MSESTPSKEKRTDAPGDEFGSPARHSLDGDPILSQKTQPESGFKECTVLLALTHEDSDSAVLISALKLAGCTVLTTTDARTTLSEFRKKHPDVVVLDYENATGHSIQFAAQLLAMRSATKIIMILGTEEASREAENIGIELFLKKPLSIRKTVDAILAVAKLGSPHNFIRK